MVQDTQIVLPFAKLSGKNLQADFDGGTVIAKNPIRLFGGRMLLLGEAKVRLQNTSSRISTV